MRQVLFLLAAMTTCCGSWGCGLTVGPQTKVEYVIVQPGQPVRILENTVAKSRLLRFEGDPMHAGDPPVQQDVGGWVAMPEEHWKAVQRALEKK